MHVFLYLFRLTLRALREAAIYSIFAAVEAQSQSRTFGSIYSIYIPAVEAQGQSRQGCIIRAGASRIVYNTYCIVLCINKRCIIGHVLL